MRRRNSISVIIVAIICCSWSIFAAARQSVDLYNTSVLLLDQSAGVRRQAAIKGLSTVVVKASGRRDSLHNATIAQALKEAETYLYEFSYASSSRTLKVAGVDRKAVKLLMRFSPGPVEKLLRDAGVPLWQASRPDVVVWVASTKGTQQRFISPSSLTGQAFKTSARRRGLPLVSPVLDLDDRRALSVSRLWAGDSESIIKASLRYQADAILAGRLRPADGRQWRGQFTLYYQGQEKLFSASGASSARVATAIVEQVSNYFASTFSVATNTAGRSAQSTVLTVNNVDDFGVYAQLLRYLERLKMTRSVSLSSVDGNRLTLALEFDGSIDLLMKTLALDKRLRPVDVTQQWSSVPLSAGSGQNPLQFEWR